MLPSFYIPFHFLPGPLNSHLTSIQVVSHPDAGPHICVSPQFMWRLSYIQFPKIASQLYPGIISKLPRMLYVLFTSIPVLYQLQITRFLSQRLPCIVSPPSRSHITFIHFTKCTSQVHPCPVSTPSEVSLPFSSCITSIQVIIIASQHLNSPIIPPCRSWGMCLTSNQAHLTSIQALRFFLFRL